MTNPSAEVEGDILMQAFLRGAGLPNISTNWQMSPEFMEMLGQMLAASVAGTFTLLGARAHLKREVNADRTVVVVRNNNPLKFLDDSQTVLTQMLRKKMPGFMAPVEAIEDAYADLARHQECMVAGMQGALADALARLDPQGLSSQPEAGLLERLLPTFQKAAMWEQYCELHAQLAREAGSDFQAVFGKAFTRAYEQHAERMLDEEGRD